METEEKNTTESITLIIESGENSLWGRVLYDENLIVDDAKSVGELEQKMKKLLFDFHDLNPGDFEFRIEYDLTVFFEQFDFLKITKIAELAGLNGSLLRQYASGKKNPSAKQVEKIENAIKQLANQLADIHIYAH
ncbi:helix-turn-helix transcriptional regulator [Dyadobacter sp. CY323]|uniref:helix-turn-helix domain-containing protein n=1 Tax=Dyadobacter sp. CY323 TaxID=2907302 RepID=UPI001F340C43|nr:helix-turn-helix transcriptional regulator [Dyadobacter sp. CY323]MCE6990300.1 helix-turn-helix transcriptional regulator [Dyadobacter sp. CY323]